jgi:hypothetical protein
MKFLFWAFVWFSLAVLGGYYLFNKYHDSPRTNEAVEFCSEKVGVSDPSDWKTLVVSAEQTTDIPIDLVWKEFSDLPTWSSWADPYVLSSSWMAGKSWEAGNIFRIKLNLGFPVGDREYVETVGMAVPKEKVAWWREEEENNSCQAWFFIKLNEKQTRIITAKVMHGKKVGYIKPLVVGNWQAMFEDNAKGLIERTNNTH